MNCVPGSDLLLDELVRPGVDVGGGLVHDEDGVVAEDGPGQADQLPLSDGEVGATFTHLSFNA